MIIIPSDHDPEVLKFKSNAAPGSFLARDNIATFIKYAKARGDVWFATHEQIARWCKANAS